jgi:hypothetical protein
VQKVRQWQRNERHAVSQGRRGSSPLRRALRSQGRDCLFGLLRLCTEDEGLQSSYMSHAEAVVIADVISKLPDLITPNKANYGEPRAGAQMQLPSAPSHRRYPDRVRKVMAAKSMSDYLTRTVRPPGYGRLRLGGTILSPSNSDGCAIELCISCLVGPSAKIIRYSAKCNKVPLSSNSLKLLSDDTPPGVAKLPDYLSISIGVGKGLEIFLLLLFSVRVICATF